MKRVLALPAILAALASVACSEPQVVVHATLADPASGASAPLANLPIRLLPYDRDAIFDSLAAAAETPEPPIPPELAQQRNEVVAAQEAHAQLEARWSTMRDSLRALSESTRQMEQQGRRSSPEYLQAFESFTRLEAATDRVKLQADSAFARFTQLQEATIGRSDSIRVAREIWAREAFQDFDAVVAAKVQAQGRGEVADTTDAAGRALFEVEEGQWWVYTRYTLPFQELYWNLEIEVVGDSASVGLTEENAVSRPIL